MNSHIVIKVMICAATCQPATLKVWDGDTFTIAAPKEKIRIENIDAPEIEGKCPSEIAKAQAAKLSLARMLDGKKIKIARDGLDKYRRTLATISVGGADVGSALVSARLARVWTGRREPWC